jgi:chromosome segregation ATPase
VKPISEYTENELAELAGSDYVRRMLAAEVMRSRQLDEVTIRHWREQMARAERAEAELASWTTVACQQTDTIDELTSELAAARGEVDLWRTRAEQAAETRNRLYSEVSGYGIRRGDNVVDLLKRAEKAEAKLAEERTEIERQQRNTMEARAEADEYSAELDRTVVQLEKTMARESKAEAELARQKPVIDAALAYLANATDPDAYWHDEMLDAVDAYRDGGQA